MIIFQVSKADQHYQQLIRKLCDIPVEDDGLVLMADSVQVEAIREEAEYSGIRVRLFGDLAGARILIQADKTEVRIYNYVDGNVPMLA